MRTFRLITINAILLSTLTGAAASQLASRPAEDWIKTLESPARVAGLRVGEVVARLGLTPAAVVADLGAGAGAFTLPLAKAVPRGKVYAVELEDGLLEHIARKAKEQGLTNVQTVRGQFTDPSLPARDVDVAFFHDVLHHVENRQAYIRNLAPYVKPGGRIVVIEFHPQQSPHAAQPELVVSEEQTREWLGGVGFVPVERVELYPDKWFVVYARR